MHKEEIQTLTQELKSEKHSRQDASDECQGLAYELVDLKNLLDDEKEKYSQLLQATERSNASHQDVLRLRDQTIDLLGNDLQKTWQETKESNLQREASFQNDVRVSLLSDLSSQGLTPNTRHICCSTLFWYQ